MAVTIQLWNEPTSGPQQFSSRFGKGHLLLGLQILSCKPHTTLCHSKNIENYNILVPGACKHASEGTGILSLSLNKSAIRGLPFLKVGFMAAAELPESVKLRTGRDLRSNKKNPQQQQKVKRSQPISFLADASYSERSPGLPQHSQIVCFIWYLRGVVLFSSKVHRNTWHFGKFNDKQRFCSLLGSGEKSGLPKHDSQNGHTSLLQLTVILR